MKDPDLRNMCRVDLEDEVMLLRAQVKVLKNAAVAADALIRTERFDTDNEIYTLREQLAAFNDRQIDRNYEH